MNRNNMTISDRIRNAQKEKKVTQKDIANKLGITPQGFQKMLKSNDFKVSYLYKIAEILNVSILFFFTDNDYDGLNSRCKTLEMINDELKFKLEVSNNLTIKYIQGLAEKEELIYLYRYRIRDILEYIERLLKDIFNISRKNIVDIEPEILKNKNYKEINKFIEFINEKKNEEYEKDSVFFGWNNFESIETKPK